MANNLLVPQADAFKIEWVIRVPGASITHIVPVEACNAINIDATPTDEEVWNETQRLRQIHNARDLGGVMSQELFSDAIVRHHKVVSAKSGVGDDALLQAVLAGQQQIKARLDKIEARLDKFEARLDAVEAAKTAPSTKET